MASQTPIGEQIANALDSPRAAVISVYADSAAHEDFDQRSAAALASRAFPHFVYNPEQASDFVSCLDITGNPSPELAWVTEPLIYLDGNDERQELQRPLTFADFAATESEFSGHFTPVDSSPDSRNLLALAEYLNLDVTDYWQYRPFVHALDSERRLVRLIPSAALLAQTMDRMHLWTTLQELSGVENPFVRAAEKRLREEFEAEKERALTEQKISLEAQFDKERQAQVSTAMRNLAARLTGMSVTGDAPAAAATAPSAKAPVAPATAQTPAPSEAVEPGASSDGPWIDQRLCTSCDECTDLNKNLFAYDANKKAIIKDEHGGPYKDLVRAAEKCASGAIHPGMPLDPNEKDLDKWIKRAEPYR